MESRHEHRSEAEPAFWVRDVPVHGRLILAPMAGFSDLPYRSLCYEHGSAMSYTEFVSAEAVVHGGNPRTWEMLAYAPYERPMVFQIFGHTVETLVEAAVRLEERGPSIIDINMGCSTRKVSGRGAGAGLLKDPAKIGRIFRALTRAVSVPVTGKIRLGWDAQSLNYLDVVKAMVDNGAALVAVHGRTKAQGYGGKANWDAIAEIVEVAGVPVLGNGDVVRVADIHRMFTHTGCAGIMIGRGAIGHPWIFQYRDRHQVPFVEKAAFMRRHFQRMCHFYGERRAVLLIRKHVARYLKGYPGIRDLFLQMVQVDSVHRFEALLQALEARLGDRRLPEGDGAPLELTQGTPGF